MSTQKGNLKRTRPQKYKNTHAFKNDLHDKTPQTKKINNIQVCKVCARCKEIIEWKIKYKKYKPLKRPKKCTFCGELNVTTTYHIMCSNCSQTRKVCPKCNNPREVIQPEPIKDPNDKEIKDILDSLSERQRRTFLRRLNKQDESDTPMLAADILRSMKISEEDGDNTFSDSDIDDDNGSNDSDD